MRRTAWQCQLDVSEKSNSWPKFAYYISCCLAIFVMAGCSGPKADLAPAEPPTVTVAQPIVRNLDSVLEFTGRLEAAQSQVVQSQVSGYLKEIKFEDGDTIEPGQVLYEIDSVPYEAALLNAKATVAKATADKLSGDQRLRLAKSNLDRANKLSNSSAISQQELDTTRTAFDTAQANLASAISAIESAEAAVLKAKFDLENCTIRNAVTVPARVSRTEITVGNLIVAGQTVLCRITSLDPIHAYWDVDEVTSLRYRQQIYDTKELPNPRGETKLACWVGLRDEERGSDGRWPHPGYVDYIAPEIIRGSGTREIRAVLDNPDYRLSPGDSIRVQCQFGLSEELLTVPEIAVGSQQQQKFVYCVIEVDGKSIAEFRPVKLGPVRELAGERLQVIEEGLSPDDRIVVNGLLRVRPGIEVKPSVAAAAKASAAKVSGAE